MRTTEEIASTTPEREAALAGLLGIGAGATSARAREASMGSRAIYVAMLGGLIALVVFSLSGLL